MNLTHLKLRKYQLFTLFNFYPNSQIQGLDTNPIPMSKILRHRRLTLTNGYDQIQ